MIDGGVPWGEGKGKAKQGEGRTDGRLSWIDSALAGRLGLREGDFGVRGVRGVRSVGRLVCACGVGVSLQCGAKAARAGRTDERNESTTTKRERAAGRDDDGGRQQRMVGGGSGSGRR